MTLSLADTHGIVKYARTFIRRYTNTHTTTKKKVEKVGKRKKRPKTEWGFREQRRKDKKKIKQKKRVKKKENKQREKRGLGGK